MVDAVYRGNIEELLSVISHLKKYVIAFVIVLLVLLSVFHFSKYSVHFVPLVIITLVLLPAVYFITVFVVKFSSSVISSNQTVSILLSRRRHMPITRCTVLPVRTSCNKKNIHNNII